MQERYLEASPPDLPSPMRDELTIAPVPEAEAIPSSTLADPGFLSARILAGIETGILGGVVMLLFFAISSSLQRQHWWSVPNLWGSAVYGNAALWKGLGKATAAGAALQLLLSSLLGILFSLLMQFVRVGGLTRFLLGLLTGAAWYLLLFYWVLPLVAPLIPLYAARGTPMLAHLLLGVALFRAQTSFEQIHRF